MSKGYGLLRLLMHQAAMDFKKRNLGTLLGSVWAIVSPLVTIGLIYFVFTFGLKAGMVGQISFLSWFIPAMLAWCFISESISTACTAIVESSYLVTKVVFPVWLLPLAKVVAAVPVHLFFMLVFMTMLLIQGTSLNYAWLQLCYYFLCSFLLCIVLGLGAAIVMVFVRDIAQVVAVCLQLLFWATPIFWNPAMLRGTGFEWILLSPFNYILQGYRDSLFNNIWFWEKPLATFIFWFFLCFCASFSLYLYRKCRPYFADVL